MEREKWEQVKEIFDAALQRAPDERERFLAENCSGDDELRREVQSLLSSFDGANSFLQKPAVGEIADVIESGNEKPANEKRFGHYQIIKQIGAGGMGEVYLADDTKLDRRVAVKILNERFSGDDSNLQRFIREAKSASGLNHPNILVIHEIGESEGAHYIVSEHIKGKTLREVFNEKSLKLSEILDIAIQTAGALCAAHEARLVHRDIKPENIMIRPDGLVKVLDFGLAKLVEQKNKSILGLEDATVKQNQTAKGVILGTVNYMSPEQARGFEIDARSDVWSLGVVVYEMLAKRTPFAGETMNDTIAAILAREPAPLDENTPKELQRIIRKSLQKKRDERYQTVKDFLLDVKNLKRELEFAEELERSAIPNQAKSSNGGASGSGENATAMLPAAISTQNSLSQPTSSAEYIVGKVSSNKRAFAFGSVILLALIGLGYWYFFNRAVKQIESIAVMPFVNDSGNSDVEYLSDGMTETLINSLSQIPNLSVKARSSVFRYKGKEFDPKKIAAELNVQAILTGRIVQRGEQMTLNLELIDAQTENILWGNKYERKSSDLVSLQREIARDVSGKLKSKLSGVEEAKVTKTHTADPEALQLYLQGQFYSHKGGRSNVLRATDHFNKAIEKDANYALAYAGLALNYHSYELYSIAPPADYMPKAKAAAMHALELDNSLAEAHVALGKSGADNAEQEFRRAIELNPNYAEAHDALCVSLTYQKRFDDAIAECKKAQDLDPSSSIVTTHLGVAYAFARRPDEAIRMFRRAHEMDPSLFVPLGYLGFAQTLKGQYTDAIATFRKAIEVSDGSPNAKSHLAYALAKAGQRDEALKLVDELKRQAAHEHIASFHFAVPYIGLGDKDEAFFWLGKGVDEQSIEFTELDVHPWFDDLRSDPRFTALLKRMNLPE